MEINLGHLTCHWRLLIREIAASLYDVVERSWRKAPPGGGPSSSSSMPPFKLQKQVPVGCGVESFFDVLHTDKLKGSTSQREKKLGETWNNFRPSHTHTRIIFYFCLCEYFYAFTVINHRMHHGVTRYIGFVCRHTEEIFQIYL